MEDEYSQLNDWDDADQRIMADDDETVLALHEVMQFRQDRRAWRDDLDVAPVGTAVYARQPASVRIVVAMREEDGWFLITRDGECRVIEEVECWAPLSSAVG